jgi:hypothetical protein
MIIINYNSNTSSLYVKGVKYGSNGTCVIKFIFRRNMLLVMLSPSWMDNID